MSQLAQVRQDFPAWQRSSEDELINAATHGLGLLIAIVGAPLMAAGLTTTGDRRLATGCLVYLASLVAVYAMSTISHCELTPKWKSTFRRLDQAFIYLLIVGTYTPYALAYLHGGLWPLLLAAMWIGAICGFVSKLFYGHHLESSSVVPYLILGWMPILTLPTLWRIAPAGVFQAIIAGGLCYMIGTAFLVNDQRVRHFHAAWHLWVIAGSACHFFGILLFVTSA